MAQNQARNDKELQQLLVGNYKIQGRYESAGRTSPLVQALNHVLRQIFDRNKELVMRIIYENYSPEYYTRTFEFANSWDYTLSSREGKVSAIFNYDPDKMDYNPAKGQHGTPDELGPDIQAAWGDAREYLAEIIYEGKSGKVFGRGPWTRKRDVWKPLIDSVESKALSTWFEQGLKQAGVKYRKH